MTSEQQLVFFFTHCTREHRYRSGRPKGTRRFLVPTPPSSPSSDDAKHVSAVRAAIVFEGVRRGAIRIWIRSYVFHEQRFRYRVRISLESCDRCNFQVRTLSSPPPPAWRMRKRLPPLLEGGENPNVECTVESRPRNFRGPLLKLFCSTLTF